MAGTIPRVETRGMVFRAYPDLKLDAGTNSHWQRSFNSRLVPENQVQTVRIYIRTQDERLEKYER
jgi:hypothetical protein